MATLHEGDDVDDDDDDYNNDDDDNNDNKYADTTNTRQILRKTLKHE